MDTDIDNCLPVSAVDLGFVLPVAQPQPEEPSLPSKMVAALPPSLSPDERDKLYEALIRQDARISVQEISRELALVALEPTTPVTQKLNINEQLIKLAGLDKKQSDQAVGGGVSITINIPTLDDSPAKTITIEQAPELNEPATAVIVHADSSDND